jgi:hypothetical protein
MFPGAGASVYYNEAGEPMGWDAPDEGPYYPDDFDRDDIDDFDDDAEVAESDRLTWGPDDNEAEAGGGQHAYYSNDPSNDGDGMI